MKFILIRLANFLLKLALDEGLRQVLPRVYRQLDAEVPILLYNNAAPDHIKGAVTGAISSAIGHRASENQVEAVLGLYDPVKAALNRLR